MKKGKRYLAIVMAFVLAILYIPQKTYAKDDYDEELNMIETGNEAPAGYNLSDYNDDANSYDVLSNTDNSNVELEDSNIFNEANITKTYILPDTSIEATLLADGTLTLTGTGDIADSPSTGMPWKSEENSITQIVIEQGITSIGNGSFYSLSNLESVDIASSVITISEGAFADCESLESITGMEGVTTIGDYAFQNTKFTTFTTPANLKTFGFGVFYGCGNLTAVNISEKVGSIDVIGYGCNSITEYNISTNNLNYMSYNGAIYTKDGQKIIAYPTGKTGDGIVKSGITEIGDYAFAYSKISNVSIPTTVKNMGEGAFFNSSLTSLKIPDSVLTVGEFLCESSHYLETVEIGNGLKKLAYKDFDQCTALKTLKFGSGLTDLDLLTFSYCSSLETVTLPEGIEHIGNGCFGECTKLSTVVMPNSLKEIWYQAFLNCKALKTINFPQHISKINNNAFWGTSIKSVSLPSEVTYVSKTAFPSDCQLNFANPIPKSDSGDYMVVYNAPIDVLFYYDKAYEVLDAVNVQRINNGLSPLTMDKDLLKAAMIRASETSLFFSHTRLTGDSCYSACSKMCAENIAAGNSTTSATMNQWMNSSGHKANILNSEYKSIGIGVVCVNGVYYWTQCFGTNTADIANSTSYCNYSEKTNVKFTISSSSEFSIKPNITNATMNVGESRPLKLAFNNTWINTYLASEDVRYVSSNESVCVVDNGSLIAKGVGSAKIAMYVKGAQIAYTSCQVTVNSSSENGGTGGNSGIGDGSNEANIDVYYRTHVQDFGWQSYVLNGQVSGTSGQSKRLEGINIDLDTYRDINIKYTTHVQDYGWLPWSSNGDMSGTEGESKRLEAIVIALSGSDADKYDVYYRVHAENVGWMGWAKNGAPAGTAGYSYRLEAIEIKVVKKDSWTPSDNSSPYQYRTGSNTVYVAGIDTPNVQYRTHVQDYGWQGYMYNGAMSGTSGQSKRLEGINIKLSNCPVSGGITYRTHVQDIGWQSYVNNGIMAGTSGQSKRLEAININLTGDMKNQYDIYYRVHCENIGWMGWAKNGECAGSAGYSYRLEGIEIRLVPKGGAAPGSTANHYVER